MTTAKQHSKLIDDKIATFTTDRDKLRDLAHEIGVLILLHAAPKKVADDCLGFGDCTRAVKLVSAMPRSWADLMKAWFKEYSPIRISSDGKTSGFDAKYKKLSPDDKLEWWRIDDARSNRFDSLDPNQGLGVTVVTLEDLFKLASQLAKRIDKIADDEDDRRVLKPEDKATAKAFASALSGLRVERVKAPANEDGAPEVKEKAAA